MYLYFKYFGDTVFRKVFWNTFREYLVFKYLESSKYFYILCRYFCLWYQAIFPTCKFVTLAIALYQGSSLQDLLWWILQHIIYKNWNKVSITHNSPHSPNLTQKPMFYLFIQSHITKSYLQKTNQSSFANLLALSLSRYWIY